MLLLLHEPITSPVIVFTSSHTYFDGKNTIAIDLITMKDWFFCSIGDQQQSTI